MKAFLTRNIFFFVIMFVFYNLWNVIYGDKSVIAGLTITQTIWYLTFTETVELARVRLFMTIQEEVKDGTIAYSLLRPYSWTGFTAARAMGENIVRIVPMMIEGFIIASLFTGFLPGYFSVLLPGFLLLVMAMLLTVFSQIIIGLLAFWFEEVMPFYMIYQKLIFIMGGMFLPIDFFPEWLQPAAKLSPFAFISYWPAITFVDFSWGRFLTCLSGQLFYIFVTALTALYVFRVAGEKVHIQGG